MIGEKPYIGKVLVFLLMDEVGHLLHRIRGICVCVPVDCLVVVAVIVFFKVFTLINFRVCRPKSE